ncbi:MAG: hypothetical protein LC749_01145 [Actinobacteria bacterium]|nr:hypothetical protein [Actinomycetota bacterium]
MPVGEELGLTLTSSAHPVPGLLGFAPQSLEVHGPSDEMLVDAPCKGVQLGAVEGPETVAWGMRMLSWRTMVVPLVSVKVKDCTEASSVNGPRVAEVLPTPLASLHS